MSKATDLRLKLLRDAVWVINALDTSADVQIHEDD